MEFEPRTPPHPRGHPTRRRSRCCCSTCFACVLRLSFERGMHQLGLSPRLKKVSRPEPCSTPPMRGSELVECRRVGMGPPRTCPPRDGPASGWTVPPQHSYVPSISLQCPFYVPPISSPSGVFPVRTAAPLRHPFPPLLVTVRTNHTANFEVLVASKCRGFRDQIELH